MMCIENFMQSSHETARPTSHDCRPLTTKELKYYVCLFFLSRRSFLVFFFLLPFLLDGSAVRVVHIPRAIWKANFCALLFVAVDRFGHTRWEYFTRWLCVAGALKKSCKTFGKYKMEACSTATVRDTHGQPNRSPI